jgi:hypothetical protein
LPLDVVSQDLVLFSHSYLHWAVHISDNVFVALNVLHTSPMMRFCMMMAYLSNSQSVYRRASPAICMDDCLLKHKEKIEVFS